MNGSRSLPRPDQALVDDLRCSLRRDRDHLGEPTCSPASAPWLRAAATMGPATNAGDSRGQGPGHSAAHSMPDAGCRVRTDGRPWRLCAVYAAVVAGVAPGPAAGESAEHCGCTARSGALSCAGAAPEIRAGARGDARGRFELRLTWNTAGHNIAAFSGVIGERGPCGQLWAASLPGDRKGVGHGSGQEGQG